MAVHETFDHFTLDSESRTLTQAGQPVHLRAKAFDLLCILVERRPHVVGREELKQMLWPETHVGQGSLDELVKVLRRALSDNAREPRYIKTYPGGRGFSFCARTAGQRSAAGFRLVWQGQLFPLASGDNLIGRGEHCQVVIADVTVSREHARIHCDPAARHASIEHLSTTNRTLVGEVEVTGSRPLASGDILSLGQARLEFHHVDDPTRNIKAKG